MDEVFFTSDQHFGHSKIIDLCKRPFTDVDQMNDEMISTWNHDVAPDDTVYVLGDFAMGQISETLQIAKRLNGKKFIVPGNHDRIFSRYYTDEDLIRKWKKNYEEVGFTILPERGYTTEDNWQLCHFPTLDNALTDFLDDRYEDCRPTLRRGQWLVHGHVHEKWKVSGRMINVSVDVWNFRPVPVDEIRYLMRKYE